MNNHTQPVAAIVVAAGSGSRLGAAVPKALVDLEAIPLVRRSVDALLEGGVERIVVTIPAGHQDQFNAALVDVAVPLESVEGGARRQDSVRVGLAHLAHLPDEAIVLIHDAARPLVPPQVVRGVIAAVRAGARAVVPAVPLVDSVRQVDDASSRVVDRSRLRAVQTPQGFRFDAIRRAHEVVHETARVVTDDAAACELVGLDVRLVPGDRRALKITEPIDLLLAQALLREQDGS